MRTQKALIAMSFKVERIKIMEFVKPFPVKHTHIYTPNTLHWIQLFQPRHHSSATSQSYIHSLVSPLLRDSLHHWKVTWDTVDLWEPTPRSFIWTALLPAPGRTWGFRVTNPPSELLAQPSPARLEGHLSQPPAPWETGRVALSLLLFNLYK